MLIMSEEDQQSALRENISKKGKNAYYYAHGNTPTGPAWDGKEEPRLLSSSASSLEKSGDTPRKMMTSFDSFSWLDETKNVKIYIDYENADQYENVSLDNTMNSIDFILSTETKDYRFYVETLANSIEKATFKAKADKFVITLKKKTPRLAGLP